MIRPNGVEKQVRPKGGWQPGADTIAYYKIDDNDTNSTIYDHSGNNKNLTWYGNPSYTTDATYGRVASFDGSSYASLDGYLDPGTTAYTFIALFIATADKDVISQGSSSSVIETMAIHGSCSLTCQNPASASNYLTPASSMAYNTWHLVAGVRDGNTFNLYIDGNYNNQKTFGSVSVSWNSGGYFNLGANRQQYDLLTGKIKTVIFENKARTAQEVADLATEYGFNPS